MNVSPVGTMGCARPAPWAGASSRVLLVERFRIAPTPCRAQPLIKKGGSEAAQHSIQQVFLPRELLMLQALGLQSIRSQSTLLVFLIIFKVAFEPFDMGIAFKGEHVGADTVEEEAVV